MKTWANVTSVKRGSARGHWLRKLVINILQDVHCVWRTLTLLQWAKQHWRVMQSPKNTKLEKPSDAMQISDFSHDTTFNSLYIVYTFCTVFYWWHSWSILQQPKINRLLLLVGISCVVCCLPYWTDFCEIILFQTTNSGAGKAWWKSLNFVFWILFEPWYILYGRTLACIDPLAKMSRSHHTDMKTIMVASEVCCCGCVPLLPV